MGLQCGGNYFNKTNHAERVLGRPAVEGSLAEDVTYPLGPRAGDRASKERKDALLLSVSLALWEGMGECSLQEV